LLKDLKMFLIDKLAPIEMPEFLEIIEVIPKTAVGKGLAKRASAPRAGPARWPPFRPRK